MPLFGHRRNLIHTRGYPRVPELEIEAIDIVNSKPQPEATPDIPTRIRAYSVEPLPPLERW